MTISVSPRGSGRGGARTRAFAALLVLAVGLMAFSPASAFALRAAADQPTAIDIGASQTTTYIGKTDILRGDVMPGQVQGSLDPSPLAGKIAVVYVMKPGKTYWSYSSNRVIYDYGQLSAGWWYRYYFKPGMTKGYYKFKAVIPKYPGFLASQSPVLSVHVK
jgi:uncharacterized protein (DUF2147 family)